MSGGPFWLHLPHLHVPPTLVVVVVVSVFVVAVVVSVVVVVVAVVVSVVAAIFNCAVSHLAATEEIAMLLLQLRHLPPKSWAMRRCSMTIFQSLVVVTLS